jgi:hypothetical protein
MESLVTLHSQIIEKAPSGALLWYALRGQDIYGSGWYKGSIEELCALTGRKASTIRRYLAEYGPIQRARKKAFKAQLFRTVHWVSDREVHIQLMGLDWIALTLGLESLGTVFFLELSKLALKPLRHFATEAEVQAMQAYASRACYAEAKKEQNENLLLDTADLFQALDESVNWNGSHLRHKTAILYPRLPFMTKAAVGTAVIDEDKPVYGTAQRTIASRLGRVPETIRYRLRNLPRIQQWRRVEIAEYRGYQLREFEHLTSDYRVPFYYTEISKKPVRRMTNLYLLTYDLKSFKRGKSRYRIKLSRAAHNRQYPEGFCRLSVDMQTQIQRASEPLKEVIPSPRELAKAKRKAWTYRSGLLTPDKIYLASDGYGPDKQGSEPSEGKVTTGRRILKRSQMSKNPNKLILA